MHVTYGKDVHVMPKNLSCQLGNSTELEQASSRAELARASYSQRQPLWSKTRSLLNKHSSGHKKVPVLFAFRCIPVPYTSCVCFSSVSKNLYVGGDEKQEINLAWSNRQMATTSSPTQSTTHTIQPNCTDDSLLHHPTLITKATRRLPPPDHTHYLNRLCSSGILTRLNPSRVGSPSWRLLVFEALHCCPSTMGTGQMKKPARSPFGSIIF